MFTKKIAGFMLLLIPAFVTAQKMPSLIPPQLPPPANNVVPAPPLPLPPAALLAPAKVAPMAPGALTIKGLSELQSREMAAIIAKQLGIETTNVAVATPATQEAPMKRFKPKPSSPNLESVIGPSGREKASFRLGNGEKSAVIVGESIGQWTIKQISNGRVQLEATANTKKISKTVKTQWVSVGDFLK